MSLFPSLPLAYQSAIGAVLVMTGVIIKNTSAKLEKASPLGPVLFVLGWVIFAYSVSQNPSNNGNLFPFVAAAIVVASVFFVKQMPSRKRMGMIGFVIGWLLVAWSLKQNSVLAFGSAILVFLSMMVVLPKQRKHDLVDGPGWPLFVFAWIGLIIANANLLTTPIGNL